MKLQKLSLDGLNLEKVYLMYNLIFRKLLSLAFSYYGALVVASYLFPSLSGFALFALAVVLVPVLWAVAIVLAAFIITIGLVAFSYFKKIKAMVFNPAPKQ